MLEPTTQKLKFALKPPYFQPSLYEKHKKNGAISAPSKNF